MRIGDRETFEMIAELPHKPWDRPTGIPLALHTGRSSLTERGIDLYSPSTKCLCVLCGHKLELKLLQLTSC